MQRNLCVRTKVFWLVWCPSIIDERCVMDIFQVAVQRGSSAIKWGVLPLLLASQSRMLVSSPGGSWSVTSHVCLSPGSFSQLSPQNKLIHSQINMRGSQLINKTNSSATFHQTTTWAKRQSTQHPDGSLWIFLNFSSFFQKHFRTVVMWPTSTVVENSWALLQYPWFYK